jgi:hypothetical protein
MIKFLKSGSEIVFVIKIIFRHKDEDEEINTCNQCRNECPTKKEIKYSHCILP